MDETVPYIAKVVDIPVVVRSSGGFIGVSMRWSVLSRVRVIADPAGSSLHGRGSGGCRVYLAEHECTPSTDTHGFMVVGMASVFGAHAGFDGGYMQASDSGRFLDGFPRFSL